ncbi:methyl-accepting chemotaxis protein [Occallatibacter riparius]|uniref:Methyl-accepting chemotaxis protein n=1 Tax=Occallatibacter riparius TaxID=1002689 RepID=A0A9J7BK26_9BACT|nr:PAS domain-containing methyl-accepting chemotaxis protein [Occallatibacter riparius]UWZ82130.1 methyl-accepting chemotaxis protein [Occallatibacter riparius]
MKQGIYVSNVETFLPENAFIYSQTDLKGRITHVNGVFAEISGYAVEEMLGKPHNLVRHPDMPAEAFADLWRSLKANRPWQGVVKNRRKDGGFYWVVANISPVRENGRVVGFQSLRGKPTREQIQAAADAYRRLREGDRTLRIEEGRVVRVRPEWVERIAQPGRQMGIALALTLLSSCAGIALSFTAHKGWLSIAAAIVFGLSGVAAGLGGAYTLPKLRRRLAGIESQLDHILSTGDLTRTGAMGMADEPISRKLTLLLTWVQSTFQCIQDAVGPVETGTQRILDSILKIQSAAESQNKSTSSVAAATAELELTIREVSEHLQTTESAVVDSGSRATEGAGLSEQAVTRIGDLSNAIKDAARDVEALSASSAEVGEVARLIREITEQTNLLALNASIEAARAGQAGRGFAVVANEVRSLADRTRAATGRIDELLSTIKGDSDRAITGMHAGTSKVDDGVSLVREAHTTLVGIDGLMSGAVKRVSEIASASSQQTIAMNEISSNIHQVAAMTEQNVGAVHTATDLIAGLSPMVDRVKKSVAQYTV